MPEPVGEFTVWIGDAKFVVPRQFYARGEYWDVLPTETEALAWIWPIQSWYRAGSGLTDSQLDGLWACIDLKPDKGYFFRTEESQGLSGYAGRAFYWATQYVAMFWSFTADGEWMGEGAPCSGISSARPYLFESGVAGPRWNVVAGAKGKAGSQFYGYPFEGWEYCDPDGRPSSELMDCDGLDPTDLEDEGRALGESDTRVLTYLPNAGSKQLVTIPRACCGSDTEQIGDFSVERLVGSGGQSAVGGKWYGNYCRILFNAEKVGGHGRVADLLLHWAHVAAALALSVEDSAAAAEYRRCAQLLGKYAALEIVDMGRLIAHEVGHAYAYYADARHRSDHLEAGCCMCGIATSWATGVSAYLGLPKGGSGYYRYTTYEVVDAALRYPCGTDQDGTSTFFTSITIYNNPTGVLQSRFFAAGGCTT